jgi:hypothetical protein
MITIRWLRKRAGQRMAHLLRAAPRRKDGSLDIASSLALD